MLVSAAKLVRWAHKTVATVLDTVSADLGKNSLAYTKMLRHLCELASSDGITLKRLKEDAANLPYFRFNGGSDKVAEAVWEARKSYIQHLKDEQKEQGTESTTKSTSSTQTDGDDSKDSANKDE